MSSPSTRCRDHDLAADSDGRCVLCRREARTATAAPERETSSLPVLPIVLASSFGLVFVGGLVLSSFLLAGSDEALAASEPEPASASQTSQTAQTPEPAAGSPTNQAHEARGTSPAAGGQRAANSNDGKADVPIEVYSASWCPACRAAKRWLDDNGYRYTDYDIDHDAAARTRLRTLNPRGSIPVIVVNRNRTFVGFNPPALEGAIAEASRR